MRHEFKNFINQFQAVYTGPNWIGDSVLSVLENMPAQIAFQKPPGNRHSIAEILKHMMVWKFLLVNRLSGDNIYDVDQEQSFDTSIYGEATLEAFKKLLSDIDDCQRELISLLQKAKPEVLHIPVAGRNYTMEYLINGVLQHDIYHLGQLAFLKKQLLQLQQV
ncbi:MAG: DinB family protein [Ginsengibacter sp.]